MSTMAEISEVEQQIEQYLGSLSGEKQSDMRTLYAHYRQFFAGERLWFELGEDENGRTLHNPTLGFGLYQKPLKKGLGREVFRFGISANSRGISLYVMDTPERDFLKNQLGNAFGKASITGYCIQFKALREVNLAVLDAVLASRG